MTKRTVEAAKPPSDGRKDTFLWDRETPGFGLRVTRSGARIYVLQTRIHGRIKRLRIGRHGSITPVQARVQAQSFLADIAAGKDPARARKEAREARTVGDLADRYLHAYALAHKKPRSYDDDRRNLALHVLPTLGTKRVAEVTGEDISKLKRSMKDRPVAFNRCRALLNTIYNLAIRGDEDALGGGWGLGASAANPCRNVRPYKETRRQRFLTSTEFSRLGRELAQAENTLAENPVAIAAIRLLIFTGARRNEILSLRWEQVDLAAGCLRLPDSKTGRKDILLNAAAIEVLEGLTKRTGNSPWVIPGAKPGDHLKRLQFTWARLRRRAGLPDLRLHDLRHSFASIGVAANVGLPVIGSLLGHNSPATTARYAHLAADPRRAAADLIGARLVSALMGRRPEPTAVK